MKTTRIRLKEVAGDWRRGEGKEKELKKFGGVENGWPLVAT